MSDETASAARTLGYMRGNGDSPRWSPDSSQLAFVSDRGDHSFIGVFDLKRSQIRWISPDVSRDISPRWSPDGTKIAFIRRRGPEQKIALIPIEADPWSIWLGDASSGAAHEIWKSGKDENSSFPRDIGEPAFHFGKDSILFASEADGRTHLYSVGIGGGDAKLLTPGDFDVEDVALDGEGRSVIYSSNQDDTDRRHIWRVDLAGGRPAQLTKGTGSEFEPVVTGDGRFMLCTGTTARLPKMPYLVDRAGQRQLASEAIPKSFPSNKLIEPKPVVLTAGDGTRIHAQLFVPKNQARPGPGLVFVHGGPYRQMLLGFHYRDYYHNAYAANQYLASTGYTVLSVNYRLSTMYGRAFRERDKGRWRGAEEYQDVVAAGRYLQSLPTVEKNRIGIWGGSHGGYLTALALARNSDLFAAGVSYHGAGDFSLHFRLFSPDYLAVPDIEAARQLAFSSSPNAQIDQWRSPVLLIHGDDDRSASFGQTVDLAQRLRDRNVPVEVLALPDEVHDFLLHASFLRAYTAMAEFFDRKLQRIAH